MEQLIAWRALQGLGAGALEGAVVHPRRRPLRRPPQRRAAGRAGGADGHQLHRRPAGRRLPHRPRRLALGVHRQPADRDRRAGHRGDRAARLGRAAASAAARRSTSAGIALLTAASGCCSSASASARTRAAGPAGWTEPRTGGLIARRPAVLVAFVAVERRAAAPIIPLRAVRRPPRRRDPARRARPAPSACSPACCCCRATSRTCATSARPTPAC